MGVLSLISPKLAADRAINRLREAQATEALGFYSTQGGGYDAAKTSRNRGSAKNSGARSVDEDHHVGPWAREQLRLEGDDLRRNDPVIAGALSRFGMYVVGEGITAKARTDDDLFNEEADDFWRDFKSTCDHRGRQTLDEICETIIRTAPIDGDGGCVLLKSGQISMVEAARIAANSAAKERAKIGGRVIEGVHVLDTGFKRGFFVAPRKDWGFIDAGAARYVPYWNFIHWARDRFRVDTVRGIGDLAPVINNLKDFKKLHEYTINKAKLDATQGGLLLNKDGGGVPGHLVSRNQSTGDGTETGAKVEEIEGLRMHYLRAGDYKSLASATPNAQYVEFAELILRLIGSGLNIPYEFLTLDFKQGSYQANRTAILTLIQTVHYNHTWLCEDYLYPLYRWRMYKAIADGDIRPAPVDRRGMSTWHRVEFSLKPLRFLDPRHEMSALREEWNLNETSVDERARARGQTRNERFREKAKDIEAAIVEAKRLFDEYGQSVSWQELMNAQNSSISFTPSQFEEQP